MGNSGCGLVRAMCFRLNADRGYRQILSACTDGGGRPGRGSGLTRWASWRNKQFAASIDVTEFTPNSAAGNRSGGLTTWHESELRGYGRQVAWETVAREYPRPPQV